METKYCPCCKRRRSKTAFGIRQIRGRRQLNAYCRECWNAKARERTREHPELTRPVKRDYMRRARADPKKRAILREQNRIHMHRWRTNLRKHPRLYRAFLLRYAKWQRDRRQWLKKNDPVRYQAFLADCRERHRLWRMKKAS